ncbi:uncharacterized protein LOC141717203 [Apium graveolens]|uniref:uncharacterized protein LOC141717203 n=1 Tax=Apium graveolens TaxID=4045 RepID=UPI003D79AD8A
MSNLAWNCRGLGNPRVVQFLKDMVIPKKRQVIFLCETLCMKEKVEKVRHLIGFESSFSVDVIGRSGGIALLWRNEEEVSIRSFSKNHIDVVVRVVGCANWRLTGFYGEPNRRLRRNTWNLLRLLSQQSNLPWCVIGDLNNILSHEDKRGGRRYPEWLVQGFSETIIDCNLIDMDLMGYSFTWVKSKGTSDWVELRLNRALVTQQWLDIHKETTLFNMEVSTSDHTPIFLAINKCIINTNVRRFRFENAWLREPMCNDIVLNYWDSNKNSEYSQKLLACQSQLEVWGKEITGNFTQRIRDCKHRMKHLKQRRDSDSLRLYDDEQNKLNEVLIQKEIYWRQRSKQLWL